MPFTQDPNHQPVSESDLPRDHHVCPVWVGRLLVSPLRRLVENPTVVLGPLVTPGSTVVDVGCAMGFHGLELARLVGPTGRVICVDIQQKMLDGLVKRARRKGLDTVIDPRLCTDRDLGLGDIAGQAELVTTYNVLHETSHPTRFLRECSEALRPGGRLLIVEPRGHVTENDFAQSTAIARSFSLIEETRPTVWRSHSAIFAKP